VAAGDVNGDGVSDAVLCYPGSGASSGAGICAVVFGNNVRANILRNLNNINGTNGFLLRGVSGSTSVTLWGRYVNLSPLSHTHAPTHTARSRHMCDPVLRLWAISTAMVSATCVSELWEA
jgi:hypothetical protein